MDAERAWWGDRSLTFEQACRRSPFMLGLETKRDTHQWTYRSAQLRDYGARLASQLEDARPASNNPFHAFYQSIERVFGLKPNRKPLLIYDLTQRLGHRYGLEPADVYLHAGTRAGAEALRPGLGRPRLRPLTDFPTSIKDRLSPAQAEDFLCLAARYLRPELWD